jgi:hypothetical protein
MGLECDVKSRLIYKRKELENENGEWRMENGEWRMDDGEWRMESGVGTCLPHQRRTRR